MFANENELKLYVAQNYPRVTDARIDGDHWDLLCDKCQVTRGFQLIWKNLTQVRGHYGAYSEDWKAPQTLLLRCPVCHAFKQWIVYRMKMPQEDRTLIEQYHRVTSCSVTA